MSKEFQITRLVWGPLLHTTRCFASVELRPARLDTPLERFNIEQSARAFGFRLQAHADNVSREPSVEYCSRITTIVDANDYITARRTAQFRMEEAVDIIEVTEGYMKHALSDVGIVRALDTGVISPVVPFDKEGAGLAMTTFDTHFDNIHYMSLAQLILSHDAQGRNDIELADRILRSSYWSRNARVELNPQLRILFRWFAIESIWLTQGDDERENLEDAISPTLWSLGFPNGRNAEFSKAKTAELLGQIEGYKKWREQLRLKLNEIRDFRNKSVHNGFRLFDIKRMEDLRYYDNLSFRACGHVQYFARCGLEEGMKDSRELTEYIPMIFDKYVSVDNVKNLIHSLIHINNFVRHVQPDWLSFYRG